MWDSVGSSNRPLVVFRQTRMTAGGYRELKNVQVVKGYHFAVHNRGVHDPKSSTPRLNSSTG